MKEYDGFLIDENFNIYSKRTGRQLNSNIINNRVLKKELREDYLGYLFKYSNGATTNQSIV